jgi:alkanesulfonate monooxygenase SsuD/methylene tetrahydromethanopterin reductase-like flavin-dependent oxidoreductase (luciferase family)
MSVANLRDRIGFGFRPSDAASAVEKIVRAEEAGISTAWVVMPALNRDTPTLLAAAAMRTSAIRLGTSIVPAFTRHPFVLVTQTHVVEDLAPGRFRLGVGTSHQRTMIAAYRFEFASPLAQLREYIDVLRPALHEGKVDYSGDFYQAKATFPVVPKTPILMSALRERAFEMAGELTDGGISWVTPADYLASTSKPALERGAKAAGRPTPPLIAHTFVSARTDRDAVRKAVRANLAYYVEAPFYQRMFTAAGYPLGPGNEISDAAIDALTISGEPSDIMEGIHKRLESGIDEVLLDVIPMGDDQTAEEDAVFAVVRRET